MFAQSQTQGRDAVWLFEITIQGRPLRFGTQRTETTDLAGDTLVWRSGLQPLTLEVGSELSEVGIEVDWGEDWPDLYAQNTNLAFSPGRLLHYYLGTTLEDARTVLEGTLRDLQLGAPGEPGLLVATLSARTPRPTLWPPSTWVIDATTWDDIPTSRIIDDKVKGAAYPIPIGYPGTGDTDAAQGEAACPALLAKYNGAIGSTESELLIAGGHVNATAVELIRTDDTPFKVDRRMRQSTLVVKKTDNLGQDVSIIRFNSNWHEYVIDSFLGLVITVTSTITPRAATGNVYIRNDADDQWEVEAYTAVTATTVTLNAAPSFGLANGQRFWFEDSVLLEPGSEYWVSFRLSDGGGIPFRDEAPMRSLGNVIIYALQRAGERVDINRALAEISRLQRFSIDTVLSGRADLSAWVDGELAGLFPIVRVQTSEGVFYRFLDFTSTERNAIAHLDLDNGSTRLDGPIQISTDSVANRFSLQYAPAEMGNPTKRVQIGPRFEGLIADTRILRDERCAVSASRYGDLEGDDLESQHIFSDSTAYEILRHLAARDSEPRTTFEVTGVDLAWALVGDVVVVTHAELGYDRQPCMILSTTFDGPNIRLLLEVIDQLT